MTTLSYILVGVALLPYIAVPILIWTTQRFSCSFHLRQLHETFLPKEVAYEFEKFSRALSVFDFEHCFDVFSTDEFLDLRFYYRVLQSPLKRTWGICTAICSEEGILQKKYSEFKTQFSGGGLLCTHNSDIVGTPIKSPTRQVVAVADTTNAEVLLRIHLLKVAKRSDSSEASELKREDAEKEFLSLLKNDHMEQVELGALYFDAREGSYRPTLAGAILLGWYSMWPSTFVRKFSTSLRSKLLLRAVSSTNI